MVALESGWVATQVYIPDALLWMFMISRVLSLLTTTLSGLNHSIHTVPEGTLMMTSFIETVTLSTQSFGPSCERTREYHRETMQLHRWVSTIHHFSHRDPTRASTPGRGPPTARHALRMRRRGTTPTIALNAREREKWHAVRGSLTLG